MGPGGESGGMGSAEYDVNVNGHVAGALLHDEHGVLFALPPKFTLAINSLFFINHTGQLWARWQLVTIAIMSPLLKLASPPQA